MVAERTAQGRARVTEQEGLMAEAQELKADTKQIQAQGGASPRGVVAQLK